MQISHKAITVIHVLPRLTSGGAETMAAELALQASSGINPIIVSLKNPNASGAALERRLREHGITLHIIGQRHAGDIFAFFRLARLFAKVRPDIVHTHLFGGELYGALAAKWAGLKHVITTEHSTNIAQSGLRSIARKFYLHFIDRVIAVSKSVEQELADSGQIQPQRLMTIPNGVDLSRFVSKPHSDKVIFTIGTVGRLEREKNQIMLIEAMALLKKYPDIHCRIAGSGSLRTMLEERIAFFGLGDRVALCGQQSDIPTFLNSLDVFVLPSLWEGLPVVLLEAGSTGLPVIASRIAPVAEIIFEGKNGLLFDSGNATDLAAYIEKLHADISLRSLLGNCLRETIKIGYDIKVTVASYEKIYHELTNTI